MDLEIRNFITSELAKTNPDWLAIEKATKALVDADEQNVRFSVDAGHIQRLGVELVGRQETALSELIKNAFDADSRSVTLMFSNHEKVAGGTLTIVDDGNGMDEQAIRSGWMRIATAAKVEEPKSPYYGRTRAGRKGIGRFAVQRLGKRLRLVTKPAGETTGYIVHFNWDDDFTQGRDLDAVFSKIERFEKLAFEQGSELHIEDLRDVWTKRSLDNVWKAVLLLQSPIAGKISPAIRNENRAEDPGFTVTINGASDGQARGLYSIDKSFLSQATATIEASIDRSGVGIVRVKSAKLALDDSQVMDETFLLTGELSLTAYYFIYVSDMLSGMAVQDAAQIGRTWGGIGVYRNGFRVAPYGAPPDDWLQLDFDVSRRNVLLTSNNRNFFGHVELTSDNNPLFEETSSREGFLENEAFHELQRFVRSALDWAVRRVGTVRQRKLDAAQKHFVPIPRKPSELIREARTVLVDVKSEASTVHKDHSTSDPNLHTVQLLEKAEAAAVAFEKTVQEERDRALEYEDMLRLLASLGLSISVFGHEVKGARDEMLARMKLLAREIEKMPEQARPGLSKQHSGLQTSSDRLFDIGAYIAGLMSQTESRELTSISVSGALSRFTEQFSDYMRRQQVEFEIIPVDPTLRTTPMHSSELDSVLLNFLTNSIKAMRLARVANRKIRLSAERRDRYVTIGFEDNGVGIPQENEGRVFDAFYTTTLGIDDDGVAGPGAGLGLKIVSDIANSYGGAVRVATAHSGFNTRFEFEILADNGEA